MGDRRPTATSGCCSPDRSPPRSAASRAGPMYGPGPVAETFPEPLTELEHDLWVPPLRDAVREAVLLAGPGDAEGGRRQRRGRVDRRPRRASTSAWPARSRPSRSLLRAAEPGAGRAPPAGRVAGRPAPRRPARSWPSTSSSGSTRTSQSVPALSTLTSRQLVGLFHRGHGGAPRPPRPRDPHGHADRHRPQPHDRRVGRPAGPGRGPPGRPHRRRDRSRRAPSSSRSRRRGWRRGPSCPPTRRRCTSATTSDSGNDNGILREALRLRVRWVQELSGRAAWELGVRLTDVRRPRRAGA